MKRVQLESPYAGDRARNAQYLKDCMRDSLLVRGEAPFASHALYIPSLDDDVPAERAVGIAAGLAWGFVAELTAVYADYGISRGMQLGIDHAKSVCRPIEYRSLTGRIAPPWNDDIVAGLKAYQDAGYVHPFTDGAGSVLIPTRDGWINQEGGPVVQTWAHLFMAIGTWRNEAFEAFKP